MAENRNVTGNVRTNVALNLTSQDLPHGKWGDNSPATAITAPGGQAFYASGTKDSAVGTSGSLVYGAPDGTSFTLGFDDPYSGSNQCSITCSGSNAQGYTYSVNYPQSGNSIVATYTIARK